MGIGISIISISVGISIHAPHVLDMERGQKNQKQPKLSKATTTKNQRTTYIQNPSSQSPTTKSQQMTSVKSKPPKASHPPIRRLHKVACEVG